MSLSIGSRDMATHIAFLTRMPRVHQDQRDAYKLRFVLNKASQLAKRPPCQSGALRLPKPRPLADTSEVFQSYRALGALGNRNERLTNTVVHISAETCFFPRHALQRTSNVFGPRAVHLCQSSSPLQPLATLSIPATTGFYARSAVRCPIASHCQIDNAKVNTHHVLWLNGRIVWHVDGAQQIEDAIPQHQISLSLDTALSGLVVRPTQERHFHPTTNGPQAGTVHSVEAQHPLIVTDCSIGSKDRADRLVALKALHRFGNGTYRKLRRQPKPFPYLIVGQTVDGDLAKHTSRKTLRSGKGRSFVAQPHGLTQGRMLFDCWQQVESQGEFHGESIACSVPIV